MNALFIGRFQPFHNGHLSVLKKIYKHYDTIIIGIGSSQYSHTKENPFSFEERKQMITESLENQNIKNFSIIAIPDIHNPPNWVSHVVSMVKDFDVVYTNNSFTQQLFLEKGYKVNNTDLIKRNQYCGSIIRNNIISDKQWENLVPKPVEHIIKKSNGIQRIKNVR
jgi:nicotinamide-nucleotide adenylyltransferase